MLFIDVYTGVAHADARHVGFGCFACFDFNVAFLGIFGFVALIERRRTDADVFSTRRFADVLRRGRFACDSRDREAFFTGDSTIGGIGEVARCCIISHDTLLNLTTGTANVGSARLAAFADGLGVVAFTRRDVEAFDALVVIVASNGVDIAMFGATFNFAIIGASTHVAVFGIGDACLNGGIAFALGTANAATVFGATFRFCDFAIDAYFDDVCRGVANGFGAALGLRAFAHTSGFARGIDAAFGRGARAENGLNDAVDAFMEKGIAGTNIGFALVGEHVFVDATRPRSTLMAEQTLRRALDDDEFLRFEIALHISILGDAV